MNFNKAYNFKEVNELVSCSGTLKKVRLQSFLDEGYFAVINLLPDESEYAVEEEKNELEKLGIHYIYIPIDWDKPINADFDLFELTLDGIKGKKVHIHCAANFRVTAFYAIYAYKKLDWTSIRVNKFIGSIWQLSEYPVWDKFVSSYLKS